MNSFIDGGISIKMNGQSFDNENMSGATFYNVNLETASFDDMNMKETRFVNVNLEGSKFTDINFKNGSIAESCIDGLVVWGHNVQELIEFKKRSLADQENGTKRLPEKIVEEFVGQAHGGFEPVAELLAEYPSLLNAAWDWGGGDWETALGAASHMGRRDIAEFLIEKGARKDQFSAAMLGELDLVKAILSSHPSLQNALGPHGIPLIAHAEKGGEQSQKVVEFLKSIE